MRSTRSSLNCDEAAFTLLELLVSMTISVIITWLVLTSISPLRRVLGEDIARTKINQDLRGSLDIIGVDVRVGGENLVSTFPAIEIEQGVGTLPDQLVVRRNKLEDVLPLCTAVSSSSTATQLFFANTSGIAGCTFSGQTQAYNSWRSYRLAQPTQRVKAFLYNPSTKVGKFFEVTGEGTNGTNNYYLNIINPGWGANYPTTSAIYLLEEWRYRIVSNTLELVENRNTANPFKIAFRIQNMQVSALMRDNTTKTSFTTSDNWALIKALKIDLTGNDRFAGETLVRTVTGEFFPRNVLSN